MNTTLKAALDAYEAEWLRSRDMPQARQEANRVCRATASPSRTTMDEPPCMRKDEVIAHLLELADSGKVGRGDRLVLRAAVRLLTE